MTSLVRVVVTAVLTATVVAVPRPATATSDELWEYEPASVSGTYTPIVGYFDNSDASDVLWYAPGSAADSLWLGVNHEPGRFTRMPMSISGVFVPLVGNFAGDWRDDILWYAPGPRPDALWVADDSPGHFDTSRSLTINGRYQPVVLHDLRSSVGHDDVVWYESAGTKSPVWHFGDGASTQHVQYVSTTEPTSPASTVLAGDWNLDRLDDVFVYGAGSRPDSIWTADPDGSFAKQAKVVTGRYRPAPVWGSGDASNPPFADSILWWGDGGAPESYWQSDGTTLVSKAVPSVPDSGVVLPLHSGVDLVYEPDAPERVFVDRSAGPFFGPMSPSGRDIGAGHQPLVGDFDADGRPDVFWYGPGASPDEVWYLHPTAS